MYIQLVVLTFYFEARQQLPPLQHPVLAMKINRKTQLLRRYIIFSILHIVQYDGCNLIRGKSTLPGLAKYLVLSHSNSVSCKPEDKDAEHCD
jgi:hypothetical protein